MLRRIEDGGSCDINGVCDEFEDKRICDCCRVLEFRGTSRSSAAYIFTITIYIFALKFMFIIGWRVPYGESAKGQRVEGRPRPRRAPSRSKNLYF
ncbi:hypothetical protein EVAR_3137_1 [Eumeta japonica]|uniref:Uncharacterized protein n=1 Tax=Eumeta variegata TaxID=151549 RepID=A0A4C1XJP9_EUMVA|nr:hypothetical protein EVAR_3137_1 [Eumeta japonica]